MKKDLNYYKKMIKKFKNLKILVVGDVMLDRFVWGGVSRISPEAPVPVVQVKKDSSMPGGSANVVANISSLGAKSYISGVIGDDSYGEILTKHLKKMNVDTNGLLTDSLRETTVKTRVIAHNQQVVRVDRESEKKLKDEYINNLIKYAEKIINDIDMIIIEDYGKGVVNEELLIKLVALAKKHKKQIAVDPKEEHLSLYKGVTVITPNTSEAEKVLGFKIKDEKSLIKAGDTLLDKLDCEAVLITRGENGMSVFQKDLDPIHIPTFAQEVFDVSGAGDTVISVFSLALSAGADMEDAAFLANIAGGIVVGKVGVATVTTDELEVALCKQLA
jgi:D-glycero-beta-D-manno-heptose-7-phosphate kinase